MLRGLRACATVALALLLTSAAHAPPAHAEPGLTSVLRAVQGQGSGHLELSPTGHRFEFFAQGEVSIHGAVANTVFTLERAVDRSPGDGVCDTTASGPDGWITLGTITTSAAGAGAVHFVRRAPLQGPRGGEFDVVARLTSADGTQVLVSDCLTVTVK